MPVTPTSEAALDHLGLVLSLLANLSPHDRCTGLDDAQAFYNAQRPEAQIVPDEGYITRLVQVGPLDWPIIPGVPRTAPRHPATSVRPAEAGSSATAGSSSTCRIMDAFILLLLGGGMWEGLNLLKAWVGMPVALFVAALLSIILFVWSFSMSARTRQNARR